jgi:hypothetical protein
MAFIGDENASCAPAQSTGSSAVFKQSSFKQTSKSEYLLAQEAINLRKQAEHMPHSVRRDELLRKAGQMDVVVRANRWATSSSLRAPI